MQAAAAAKQDNMIHNPYNVYRMLKAPGTKQFYEGVPIERCSFAAYPLACSGINVFTPKAWWSIGGGDEKFMGWGYEDTAMQMVHQLVHGEKYLKHRGNAYSLAHKAQSREDDNYINNKKLFEEYEI
jgi:hypothetical protein